MAMLRVFKSSMQSMRYIFASVPGREAAFAMGRYCTQDPKEIEELEHEISLHHPHIYIDPENMEIDEILLDPIQAFKAQVEAEIRAKIAAENNPDRDMGNTEAQKLTPQGTNDIQKAAAGSTSGVGLPQLLKAGGNLQMLAAQVKS